MTPDHVYHLIPSDEPAMKIATTTICVAMDTIRTWI
jgi:hypothetical protein